MEVGFILVAVLGNVSVLRRNDIISFSSSLLNYCQSLWPLDFQVLQMFLNIPGTMFLRLTRHLIALPVSPFLLFMTQDRNPFLNALLKKKKLVGGT